MAKPRLERHPAQIAWAASGNINLELSPKPYTITEMILIVRASVTTTTATNYNDYWDRLISRLNLTGRGETYFDFSNMRAAYHLSRFGGFAPKRPTVVADSATTLVQHFAYVFHFGVAPWRINAAGMLERNPWDLTGGIPPVQSGNLTLGGSFAAASAMGSNVTIADGDIDVYLYGVQPDAGDHASLYLPRAIPVWSMESPSLSATSSAFATAHDVPAGHLLHSMLVMLTNGSNSPRDDSVLNSLRLYNQLENREILAYGGQTGVAADYKAAEIISQLELESQGWPPTDNISTAMTALTGTPGVPAITASADSGLIWLPVHKFAWGGDPLYGADLRNISTGNLKLQYGISDATGVTMDIVYRKYKPNPDWQPYVVARAA